MEEKIIRFFDSQSAFNHFRIKNNPASAATPAGQNNLPAQTAPLDNFDQLNEEGQTKALDYVEDLVLTGRYKKAAAHGVVAKEA